MSAALTTYGIFRDGVVHSAAICLGVSAVVMLAGYPQAVGARQPAPEKATEQLEARGTFASLDAVMNQLPFRKDTITDSKEFYRPPHYSGPYWGKVTIFGATPTYVIGSTGISYTVKLPMNVNAVREKFEAVVGTIPCSINSKFSLATCTYQNSKTDFRILLLGSTNDRKTEIRYMSVKMYEAEYYE